jgi:shikimate 5-dehydrogenase
VPSTASASHIGLRSEGAMADEGYWSNFQRRLVSRRRMLQTGVVIGAGGAAAAIIGCGDDDSG